MEQEAAAVAVEAGDDLDRLAGPPRDGVLESGVVRAGRLPAARQHPESDQVEMDGVVYVGDQTPDLDIPETCGDVAAGGVERQAADQPAVASVHAAGPEAEVAHADRVLAAPGGQIIGEDGWDAARV